MAFECKYKVGIDFSPDQEAILDRTGKTPLTITQLSQLLDDLYPTEETTIGFIEEGAKILAPISMTLYVINDATWKLMKKKPDFLDKMLPMSTIPWFYWDSHLESKANPRGIRRDENGTSVVFLDSQREELIISGEGGDFCGVVDEQIDRGWAQGRSIIIPGGLGPKKEVVSYKDNTIIITLKIANLSTELYPKPEARFDYGFSESPKVFYEHGIKITTDGLNAKLRIGRGREVNLSGEIVILLGKSLQTISWSEDIILFHIWLKAIDNMVGMTRL
jgi:hypothetical protein